MVSKHPIYSYYFHTPLFPPPVSPSLKLPPRSFPLSCLLSAFGPSSSFFQLASSLHLSSSNVTLPLHHAISLSTPPFPNRCSPSLSSLHLFSPLTFVIPSSLCRRYTLSASHEESFGRSHRFICFSNLSFQPASSHSLPELFSTVPPSLFTPRRFFSLFLHPPCHRFLYYTPLRSLLIISNTLLFYYYSHMSTFCSLIYTAPSFIIRILISVTVSLVRFTDS